MLAVPKHVRSICHPLIDDIYVKQEFKSSNPIENILVIETKDNSLLDEASSIQGLLKNLKALEEQVRATGIDFNHVDIKRSFWNDVVIPNKFTT